VNVLARPDDLTDDEFQEALRGWAEGEATAKATWVDEPYDDVLGLAPPRPTRRHFVRGLEFGSKPLEWVCEDQAKT